MTIYGNVFVRTLSVAIRLRRQYYYFFFINNEIYYIYVNLLYYVLISLYFRGKNVLNQKSELEKALSKHKEKQILNQVKEHRETPGNIMIILHIRS